MIAVWFVFGKGDAGAEDQKLVDRKGIGGKMVLEVENEKAKVMSQK
jgi:hypothetical protein